MPSLLEIRVPSKIVEIPTRSPAPTLPWPREIPPLPHRLPGPGRLPPLPKRLPPGVDPWPPDHFPPPVEPPSRRNPPPFVPEPIHDPWPQPWRPPIVWF